MNVGIIGVGKISEQYFESFPSLPGLNLVAVSDLDEARAAQVAVEQGVESLGVEELLADPRIEMVLNLTIPAAHAGIATRALAAGKHVYGEKPLALAPEDAAGMLALAEERGLRVGSAPDTVLGTGIQTALELLVSGRIGAPVGAAAFWSAPGHEAWHPAPHFYYQHGGGPLFDMGPYYLTTLVLLLGPVVRVSGAISRSERARSVATGPGRGQAIDVSVETHISAILEHDSGLHSTVTVSFEIWMSRTPKFEAYGTLGTIAVPDPNRFSDPVELWTPDQPEWTQAPVTAGYSNAGRGYGLADMAHAIRTNRPHRASGELAFHVLEIMDAVVRAGTQHATVELTSTVDRPALVPYGATPDSW
ncbi:MAG: oxidoreductase [Cryobacterium sp.]|jgi:predicted dehydrogenase|nr:oxidoreductase [Cryobacterium sp.]